MKSMILSVIAILFTNFNVFGKTIKPTTIKDFNKVTVMVKGNSGGGSGVILQSTKTASYILTNRHVCAIAKSGSLQIITNDRKKYDVEKYKFSKKHDVCIAKVTANLIYSTKLASERSSFGESITVSGHPYLYPNMVQKGHMSEDMTISIVTGFAECEKKDYKNFRLCSWLGKLPIISRLESQTASVYVAGGNSGSAIFNEEGEITALVYAGRGRGLSPAILVPHEYIVKFLKEEIQTVKWNNIKNSYIYGKKNSSKKFNFKGVVKKSTENLIKIDLKFPAIKSKSQDKFISTYECLKKGESLCLIK